MKELQEELQTIQKYLYSGYKNDGETNAEWLNVSRAQNNIFS